jgi:UDPglucose 6-dehydrogenase
MYKIGIIGKGFVGAAVAQGMSAGVGFNSKIKIYDKDPSRSSNSLEDVLKDSDFLFISVPTPSKKNGEIDLSVLENCIKEIDKTIPNHRRDKAILLIRSTIVPGSTSKFAKKFKKLRFVFNPEFLTERSALFDFISQSRFILGGVAKDTRRVAKLYRKRFGATISIVETNFQTAELIKYMNNTFFATKVSFLNEMFLISKSVKANWPDAMEGFLRDGRVGHSHSNVPGPDGKLGFGGSCFPKDVQALINFGDSKNLQLNVLKGAWETNLNVRPERDWESLKGRAVSDKDS